MAGSADKLCGWPGCTRPWDPADGVFCEEHTVTVLDRVHKVEAMKARELLAEFRSEYPRPRGISIGGEYADNLEQKICEALVEAYNRGRDDYANKPGLTRGLVE